MRFPFRGMASRGHSSYERAALPPAGCYAPAAYFTSIFAEAVERSFESNTYAKLHWWFYGDWVR
jgi:hypothetical protein